MEFEKRKGLIISIITIGIIMMWNSKVMAQNELSEFEKAFKEVTYAYYMRGINIQYNSQKGNLSYYSPEEATSQNINYLTCSAYTKNVYNDLLGIMIPPYTNNLLEYARENIGNPEVIAYGSRNKDNNLVMNFYNKNVENNYITITNVKTSEFLKYLKCGDIITYTGHTMLVYDLIYDDDGNVKDAYIIESAHGNNGYNAITKMPKLISIGENIKFGSSNPHYLYYNSRNNTSYEEGIVEGSLHLDTLKNVSVWKDLENSKQKEYSVLRFVNEFEGGAVLNYHGKNYNDNEHNEEIISLSEKTKDRLKFSKLYIEKIADKHNDNVVKTGEEITYKIIIKNNSKKDYTEDIIVTENISDYVNYKKYTINKKNVTVSIDKENNKVKWNIGILASGEEVVINYTVKVKENSEGQVINSTGAVGNIPSSVIKNTVANNLTEKQEQSIERKYEELKDTYKSKELINEIYKQALGVNLGFDKFDITKLIKNTNFTSLSASTNMLDNTNDFYEAVLNKYWNTLYVKKYLYDESDIYAYDMKVWKAYTDESRKADTIYKENFKTGDVLIYLNDNDYIYNFSNNVVTKTPVTYESGEYVYIYIKGKGFVGVNLGNDGIAGTKDDRNEFNAKYYSNNDLNVYSNKSEKDEDTLEFMNYQTLLGKDYYVILRPAMMLEGEKTQNSNINENTQKENVENNIELKNDTTVAKSILPNAGKEDIIIFILLIIVLSIIMWIKVKKYKNIK